MMQNTATHAAAPLLLIAQEQPLPDDVRVSCLFQPTAPLGHLVVSVGLGQGSRGKGQRVGDDAAVHVALIARLAQHLAQYARDYATEAAADEPNWPARLRAADAALAVAADSVRPGRSTLCPCGEPAATTEHCATCIPF